MTTIFFTFILPYLATGLSLHSQGRQQLDIPKLVFDLGLNTGEDTENFLNRGFRVIALDANPAIIQVALKKPVLKQALEDGRLKILNLGISNVTGEFIDFWVPEIPNGKVVDSWGESNITMNTAKLDDNFWTGFSSFEKSTACRFGSCTSNPIKTITCADLLAQEGTPYYIKIDIEGRDILCLKSIMEKKCGSELPPYISFENFGLETWRDYYMNLYGENGNLKGLMQLMHIRGYTEWKRSRGWVTDYLVNQVASSNSFFGEEVMDLDGFPGWKPTRSFSDKVGCDVNCRAHGTCEGYCDMHTRLNVQKSKCA